MPGGRWIAFATGVEPGSAHSEIFIVSVDDRLETSLVAHPASDRLLDWTPDGQRVFFVSNRAGTWENDVYLATIGASGKIERTTKVAAHVAWDSTVQWSPDGRFLVYARGNGDQEDPFVLVVRNSETAVERQTRCR